MVVITSFKPDSGIPETHTSVKIKIISLNMCKYQNNICIYMESYKNVLMNKLKESYGARVIPR